MTETATACIDDCSVSSLRGGSKDVMRDTLEKLFCELDEAKLSGLLAGYCTDDVESYGYDETVDEVELYETSQDVIKGHLEVKFSGFVYRGCKNMDYQNERFAIVAFTADIVRREVAFTTDPPDPIECSTVDEF